MRLDQQNRLRAGGGKCECRGKGELYGDEGHVGDDEVHGPVINVVGCQEARIQPFQIGHARIVLDPWMHLPVADIDGGDVFCAAMKQYLGEAAGGGADVEAFMALRIEPEVIERGGKLEGGAGNIGLRRIGNGDLDVSGNGLAGLCGRFPVDAHGAARNRIARTRAAGKVAERNKKLVKPFIFRCFGHGPVSMTAKPRRCKRFIARKASQRHHLPQRRVVSWSLNSICD